MATAHRKRYRLVGSPRIRCSRGLKVTRHATAWPAEAFSCADRPCSDQSRLREPMRTPKAATSSWRGRSAHHDLDSRRRGRTPSLNESLLESRGSPTPSTEPTGSTCRSSTPSRARLQRRAVAPDFCAYKHLTGCVRVRPASVPFRAALLNEIQGPAWTGAGSASSRSTGTDDAGATTFSLRGATNWLVAISQLADSVAPQASTPDSP